MRRRLKQLHQEVLKSLKDPQQTLNKVQLIFEQADAAAVPVNEVEIRHHNANRFLKI